MKPECLEYALTYRIDHGVWGGASERERRRILRRRRVDGGRAPRSLQPVSVEIVVARDRRPTRRSGSFEAGAARGLAPAERAEHVVGDLLDRAPVRREPADASRRSRRAARRTRR